MKISWNVSFFAIILYALGLVCSGHDCSKTNSRVNEHEQRCSYRRQQGLCRPRSECTKPTRNICRPGPNPVVCCLDQPKPKAPLMPFTGGNMDLTFPGCGMMVPNVQENTRPRPAYRRGRRSQIEVFPYSRTARDLLRPLIVGGIESKVHSWPWMCALFKRNNLRSPKRLLCGASLISKKCVLCAAHCFQSEMRGGNVDASKFFVVMGSHTTRDGIEYPVESVSVHPGFRKGQYHNDISVMRIRGEVQLTENVYPVCLPSDGLANRIDPSDNMVTVTGWGHTEYGGERSEVLQEVTLPIVPNKECDASLSKLRVKSFPKEITNMFICAGLKEGGKDSCQGDSGGPLVSRLTDGSFVQVGIVSFGYGCAFPGIPGVYTRVSQYTKWLHENTDLGRA